MADEVVYIYGTTEVEPIHQIEPLTAFSRTVEGKPGGMLLEVGSTTYVPKGWTKIWPIGDWLAVGPAKSIIGSTDPETLSTVYLEYLGEEMHIVGDPPALMQTSAFIYIQSSGYVPILDPTTILNSMTCYVSYDFGESWHNFFQLNGRFTLNGVLTDRLAQNLALAATRLGMRKPDEGGDLPKYSRLVFDNTFFTEYHQLWLEDENERIASKGGVGVTPIFERMVEGADDPGERLAVHSGTWGVIRKRNTIVASTFCPVNWCQNSDAPQVPVPSSPFCYSVNTPKEIMWIGPAAYLSTQDDPAYHDYFSGPPQEDAIEKWDTTITDEAEYGAGLVGLTASWRDDGMVLYGSADIEVALYEGWSSSPDGKGFRRAYFAPDYRNIRVQYAFPYYSYIHPTSTTVFIFKMDKTEGDIPVYVNQVIGGSDEVPTLGHVFEQATHWYDTGGGWFGQYYYKQQYTAVPEPYRKTLWTFAKFKQRMLALRGYAVDVAHAVVNDWGGIVRSVIRTPAERDYWNNRPFSYKNYDMCQLGCTIVGEYDINGRYNLMTRPLFTEFTYYSASFFKFFVAEEEYGSIEESGNSIFELFQSAQHPGHYAVSILPSKSFGNVIYGIKSYYEVTHTIERRQALNYTRPSQVHTYNQEQYGMIQYAPVVSEDGGVTWHDVTGLTNYDKTTPRVQFKPIWLGQNQWICEHNSKLYKSFTGVGWSPLTHTPDEEWENKLDPSLDGDKTYIIDVPCRNEWLAVHQYEGLPSGIVREAATLINKTTLRMSRQVVSVDGIYSLYNGFEREYAVKRIYQQTLIELTEDLPVDVVYNKVTRRKEEVLQDGVEVYVSYQTKTNVARLFHVIADPDTSNLTYIVKDLSFIGDEWFPKQNLDLSTPYDPSQGSKCAINTLSGGLLSHLYYLDPVISAKANLFPSDWQPLEFKTTELPEIIIGTPYFAKLEVVGGQGPYKYTGLQVPPGLTLAADSGEFTGIVNAQSNDYAISVVADDSSTPAYADPTNTPATSDENPPLYGYVYDGAGAAVANATVTVMNPYTGAVESEVQTDTYGRYTVNLPANTPRTVRIGKDECVGSDVVSIAGGSIGRWDGNIGNGGKGTTTMGQGVNQKPPYDQERGTDDPPTADNNYMGTRGTQWPVATGVLDDRAPEFILAEPNFERFVFGQPVSIKLVYSYTDPNREAVDPFVTMVYNSPGFPPDLLPAPRPSKISETEFRQLVGPGIANFLMFGPGRFGLVAEITGTLDQNNGQGQPYTQPVTFDIPPIGVIDSKGRSVYSSTITLTGVPLAGEESVPPEVKIDSPQNYHMVALNGKVTIEGSASDDSGLSSLTVGGQAVVVTKGLKRIPFAQELTMQELGCIKIDATAIDDSLRRNTATKSVYIRVGDDNQAPSLSVSTPSGEDPIYMFSPSYEFSGPASDSGKGDTGIKQVKVGNQIVDKSSCDGSDTVNWTHKYTGLNLGTNVITIEAEDNAGNKTTVTRTIVRHEDTVGPKITVTSPDQLDIWSYGSEHTIQGSITDSSYGNNGVQRSTIDGVDLYQPGGSKKATCTGSASVQFEKQVVLAMGYNSFNIGAWDELGNRSEVTIVIRRMAP